MSDDERISTEQVSNIIARLNEISWRVIQAGKESGPFSDADLIGKATAGELGPNDLVKHGDGLWTRACDIPLLMQEFHLKDSRQKVLDELGRFKGIWVSRKALMIGGCIVLVLAVGVLAWGLFKPTEPTTIHAKQEQIQPPPHVEIPPKLTDEERNLMSLGREFRTAPFASPLADVGKSFFVLVSVHSEVAECYTADEAKTKVELRLRQAGFVVGPKSPNVLFVNVQGLWQNSTKTILATHVRLSITSNVLVRNNKRLVRTNAVTWQDGSIGIAGQLNASKNIQNAIDSAMDKLMNEYLAANPPIENP